MIGSFLLVIAVAIASSSSAAVPAGKSSVPVCVKVDECSCKLENVSNPGLINFHSLVRGHKPVFEAKGKSEQSGREYDFFYNPCLNFTDYSCQNTSICQVDENTPFDLGQIESVKFEYHNNSVVAVYNSAYYDPYNNRTSYVELVCDEQEKDGVFEYISEPIRNQYNFKLRSRCACPGKCLSSTPKECVTNDTCSCTMNDGSGTVNLRPLDNPADPMNDELAPAETYYYNPCSPVASPDCGDDSVCVKNDNKVSGLGLAKTASFKINDDNDLVVEYTMSNSSGNTKVLLVCDPGQREKPFFKTEKDEDETKLEVYSVCACPNGCASPPSSDTCDQVDACTCKADDAEISLHNLDNPYAPLVANDTVGYSYFYNPCSGIKLKTDVGKCNNVGACQKDPFHKTYYDIGLISPTIEYDSAWKNFTFHYGGGQGGRSFSVQMVCDPKAHDPVLTTVGNIPKGALHYPMRLTTVYACV